MEFRVVAFLAGILAFSHHLCAEDIDFGTVILSQVLFRHGDRTPVDPYRNDPYRNESLWPVPFAQLTPIGVKQEFALGQWLRQRYNHFLPDLYSIYDIFVRSTDTDRTLMSAEANLAGLYPPRDKQIWADLKWMPIPVHTLPEESDFILAEKAPCARYEYEMQKLLESPEIERINEENADLYDYLTLHCGDEIDNLIQLEYLYNTLTIESLWNKTLPKWTETVYPHRMEPLAALSFTLAAYNKILARLKSGPLLGEMVKHMKKKSQNELVPDRKLFMFSAHDGTIANLLMALGVFEAHCPPYAAAVLIELRKNSKDQHIVTVSYKNSSDEPTVLTLPGCSPACPLQKFIRLTKDVIPEDWEKECAMESAEYHISNSVIIAILSWSVLFLVSLLLSIFTFVYSLYRRDNSQYYLRLSTDPI